MVELTKLADLVGLILTATIPICFLLFEVRQQRSQRPGKRALAVLFSLLILFPSLSISDDLAGFALITPSSYTQDKSILPFDSSAGADLELGIRLAAVADFEGSPFHFAAPNSSSANYIPTAHRLSPARSAQTRSGRAPPIPN